MDSLVSTHIISPSYLDQIRSLHGQQVWGASGYSHAPEVSKYRREIGATTVLDFGCGRGTLKPALLLDPNIEPEWISEYDPAIEGKDEPPQPADLLVANDVLEHIEPECLDKSLRYLRSLATMGAYFTIALTASKVSLPDGRNAHLIIQPENWWKEMLKTAGFHISYSEMRKGLWVWAK